MSSFRPDGSLRPSAPLRPGFHPLVPSTKYKIPARRSNHDSGLFRRSIRKSPLVSVSVPSSPFPFPVGLHGKNNERSGEEQEKSKEKEMDARLFVEHVLMNVEQEEKENDGCMDVEDRTKEEEKKGGKLVLPGDADWRKKQSAVLPAIEAYSVSEQISLGQQKMKKNIGISHSTSLKDEVKKVEEALMHADIMVSRKINFIQSPAFEIKQSSDKSISDPNKTASLRVELKNGFIEVYTPKSNPQENEDGFKLPSRFVRYFVTLLF